MPEVGTGPSCRRQTALAWKSPAFCTFNNHNMIVINNEWKNLNLNPLALVFYTGSFQPTCARFLPWLLPTHYLILRVSLSASISDFSTAPSVPQHLIPHWSQHALLSSRTSFPKHFSYSLTSHLPATACHFNSSSLAQKVIFDSNSNSKPTNDTIKKYYPTSLKENKNLGIT